jgi:hypothetical protein
MANPAITCSKYQVFLYGSEAITYLNAIPTLSDYRASSMSHHTAPTPHYRQPSPPFVWQHYLDPFERELLYG